MICDAYNPTFVDLRECDAMMNKENIKKNHLLFFVNTAKVNRIPSMTHIRRSFNHNNGDIYNTSQLGILLERSRKVNAYFTQPVRNNKLLSPPLNKTNN